MLFNILYLLVAATAVFAECEEDGGTGSGSVTVDPGTTPAPGATAAPVVGVTLTMPSYPNKCWNVRDGLLADGTAIEIRDCDESAVQRFMITRGVSGPIKVANSNFCVDAGTWPYDGAGLKIWTCYDNLAAQKWTYNSDNTIHHASGQAVDLPGGYRHNGNQLQTWTAHTLGINQKWMVGPRIGPRTIRRTFRKRAHT